jgi:hypothetical protein
MKEMKSKCVEMVKALLAVFSSLAKTIIDNDIPIDISRFLWTYLIFDNFEKNFFSSVDVAVDDSAGRLQQEVHNLFSIVVKPFFPSSPAVKKIT